MHFVHVDGKRRKAILVNCQHCCNLVVCRHDRPRKVCSNDCHYNSRKVSVRCAFCDDEFTKQKSSLKNSRSGLFFCCREHKDLAQRIDCGILEIGVYKDGYTIYRERALLRYGAYCEKCGFDDIRAVDVHHIDVDRGNNKIENLIVLCANCHALVTRGYVIITEDRQWIEQL